MADKSGTLAGSIPSAGAAFVGGANAVTVRKTGTVKRGNDLRTGSR